MDRAGTSRSPCPGDNASAGSSFFSARGAPPPRALRASRGGLTAWPAEDGRLVLVDLRGEDEVALGQAVDLVRPDRHAHLSIRQIDVGVMPLLFGNSTDLVREGQGTLEILERERLLDVVIVDDRPAVNLGRQRVTGLGAER